MPTTHVYPPGQISLVLVMIFGHVQLEVFEQEIQRFDRVDSAFWIGCGRGGIFGVLGGSDFNDQPAQC